MTGQLSRAGGAAFAVLFRALKIVRPRRPIHPAGVFLSGTIERFSSATPSGIEWVDHPGTDRVEARMSRSIGLPAPVPDILGLALRIYTEPHFSDVLVASTGISRIGRFVLLPSRRVSSAAFTTLMPYAGRREAGGSTVLLAVRPLAPDGLPAGPDEFRHALGDRTWSLGLYHARAGGPWHRFGTLSLAVDPTRLDTDIRFDPVLHPLVGAGLYSWVRRLREPAYAAARR